VKEGRGRILVIRGGAIGDFILTLPVFAALRQRFPDAHLEVLGYPHIAQLALAGGLADEVRCIEARALAGFFARNGSLDEQLTDYFAGFALVISFLYDPDGIFQENVGRCSKAQFIAGPHRPDEKLNVHASEVFLKPLERLTIFDADPVPRLNLVSAIDVPLSAGRWLAVHPGSGSEKKNWPEENWGALIADLVRCTDLHLLMIGGEAEAGRCERLSGAIPVARVQFARNLPLWELAHWLKQCSGFVGHDSGISHLAAALGLTTLVLWGESNEAVWKPRNERAFVLRHPAGLRQIPVRVVAERLSSMMRTGA
jgi:heptosyltransferase-2